MSNSLVVMLIVGAAFGAAHFACAQADTTSEPLPLADAPPTTTKNTPKPDPPKTSEVDFDAGPRPAPAPDPDAGASERAKASCDAVNTCATARKATIASIPGDYTLTPFEIRGSTAEFVTLRITEDSSLWYDLKLKATLVSPPGTNFDLAVFVPRDDVANDCSNIAGSSHEASGDDVARATWSDSLTSDDSRTVVFQIIHVSGDCTADPNARWVLRVQGYVD